MPKKKLYYLALDVKRSHEEGFNIIKNHFVEIEDSYVKRFKIGFYLLAQLSKTERLFLEYITEVMDNDNFIANNKATREAFNLFMRKLSLKEFKDSTIHKCFSRLCKLDIILTYKGKRGLYQVSPLFFYSSNKEDEREKLIRAYLEEPNKDLINKYRHDILKKKA